MDAFKPVFFHLATCILVCTLSRAFAFDTTTRVINNDLVLSPATDSVLGVGTQVAFPDLGLSGELAGPNTITELTHAGDGSNRLFVAQQKGQILVFDNNPATATYQLFIDITDRVSSISYEDGLLGLAFHPDFLNNGKFYLSYTNDDVELES